MNSSLTLDFRDLNFGIRLTVTHTASRTLLGTIGDDIQLLALAVLDDLALDGRALNGRSADLDTALFAQMCIRDRSRIFLPFRSPSRRI